MSKGNYKGTRAPLGLTPHSAATSSRRPAPKPQPIPKPAPNNSALQGRTGGLDLTLEHGVAKQSDHSIGFMGISRAIVGVTTDSDSEEEPEGGMSPLSESLRAYEGRSGLVFKSEAPDISLPSPTNIENDSIIGLDTVAARSIENDSIIGLYTVYDLDPKRTLH